MKKYQKLLALLVATVSCATSVAACGGGGGGDVELDENKTQLYVYCSNAGFGIEWLNESIKEYEKINANREFEPGSGKKGIQIVPETPRAWPEAGTVKMDKVNEVFFLEGISYRAFKSADAFANISDAITETNPYDDPDAEYTTIASRFNDQQKNCLSIDGEYYAIPHFYANYGFIYNQDLFDEWGWYFDTEGVLIEFDEGKTKSAGPNGKLGDYDDGLPATYEQFFQLCDHIASYQMVPVCWTGTSYMMHFEGLLNALVADYEGYEDMTNRLNFTGSQLLAKMVDGEIQLDGEGNVIVEDTATEITSENAYDVFRQPGIYYALSFIEKLIKTNKYHNEEAFGDYAMTEAQEDFIYAGVDGETKEIAMLLDGDWWMEEATEVFDDTKGSYGSQYERNFKAMPLPKATEDKIGENFCDYDDSSGFAFVNGNIQAEKLPVAIDFLQFMYSNDQLVKYTQRTNTLRPLKYTMTEAEKNACTPYAKSLFDYKLADDAERVLQLSNSPIYEANQAGLRTTTMWRSAYGVTYRPAEAFYKDGETGATAVNYFEGFYKYWKNRLNK